jgi:chromosome segregation ATPase
METAFIPLARKSASHEEFSQSTKATRSTESTVRHSTGDSEFSKSELDSRVVLMQQVAILQKHVKVLQEIVTGLRERIEEKHKENQRLDDLVQTLQTEIQTLKSESERYRRDSEWHRSELCSFLRLVDDRKNVTAVKHQGELDDLKAVVERLQVEHRSLCLHNTRLSRGVSFLSLQMDDMQAKIQSQTDELAAVHVLHTDALQNSRKHEESAAKLKGRLDLLHAGIHRAAAFLVELRGLSAD